MLSEGDEGDDGNKEINQCPMPNAPCPIPQVSIFPVLFTESSHKNW
ncbi:MULTISPECIES: hypothetical protein [unclassified Nostoc]|nr:hypothetical protein [Nostoc sp. S13]MDF5737767.1 hypothetical protein [Nostoc sp. S13]